MQGLIDSTLREGGQMVGVNFSLDQKLAIVSHLNRIGIEEIEVGIATRLDHQLPELLAGCREMGSRARLALWCLCREEDIAAAARLKPDVLSLSIPASDLHITKKLGKNRGWVLETLGRSVNLARELGCRLVSLGLEDATRAEAIFREELIDTAIAAGVERIRLADTVGVSTPLEMAGLVKSVKEKYRVEVGVHCHNDFGMATANSLAALEAGADWADVTVLGLGERAGNARLEEVAAFLALRRGHRYRAAQLRGLAELVSRLAGHPITPHHPVLGEKIFHCESGLHLQGLNADPETYEPYCPELVGAERRLLYGVKIGKGQLRRELAKTGFQTTPRRLETLIRLIRSKIAGKELAMKEDEFHEFVTRTIQN